jgi:hypothetical protein
MYNESFSRSITEPHLRADSENLARAIYPRSLTAAPPAVSALAPSAHFWSVPVQRFRSVKAARAIAAPWLRRHGVCSHRGGL